jgi:S1-C subfamily serine protease
MNAGRARWIRGSGGLAFLAVALLGVIALGAVAGNSDAKSASGYLGVSTQELDDELRDSYDYRGPGGVLVQTVGRNSAADKAGIRRGDILVRYAGTSVESPDHLGRLVRADAPGKRVPISVWRDGREMALQVEVGSREDSDTRTRVYLDEGDDDDHVLRWREMPHAGELGQYFNMLTVRPRLGVEVQDLNPDLGSYFQVPDGGGVLVTKVIEDTPAERAGMKAGDVILDVGGKSVATASDLQRELRDLEPGAVRLTVQRRGTRQSLTAQIEEREAPGATAMRVPRGRMWAQPDRIPDGRRDARMRELERELDELRREMDELRRDSDR